MKKITAIVLALVMLLCSVALVAADEAAGKKVVFLVNGNLGDKGFYDSIAEGVNRLGSDYGCEIKIIEMGRDETTYETYFRDVSEQDWDLIIGATWSVQEVFEEVAADYPEKSYLFLDGSISTANMIGISFQSNVTGFMAGALAALKLKEGDAKIDASKKLIGVVASMDATNLNDFLVGYWEGAAYVDPEIKCLTSYVGSFEDVATCKELTTQLYTQGAQIVYAPASQSILGAVTASQECDKFLIGCDTDIYTIEKDMNPELVANVLSSSMKRMGDAVVYAATSLWNGSYTLGENYTLSLAENAVGLADNENYQALVSEATRAELEAIAGKVMAGEITIDTAYAMENDAIAAMREAMKP